MGLVQSVQIVRLPSLASDACGGLEAAGFVEIGGFGMGLDA